MYKSFGPLSIAIAWLALGLLVYQARGDKTKTFSKIAAADRRAYMRMAILQSIIFPMYFIFIVAWFVPTFHLPVLFTVLNGLASLALLVAAWVPDTGGVKAKIHGAAAYLAYGFFIPILVYMATCSMVGSFARIFSGLAVAYMLIGGSYLLFAPKARQHVLPIQALFLISFHASILFSAYLRV